jgi:hypothetical protein
MSPQTTKNRANCPTLGIGKVCNEVSVLLNTYDPEGFYDELFLDDGQPRPPRRPL